MQLDYHVVDVFTQSALEGNPLAVFPNATGLDAPTMQRIARELNLSETTFVFPATGEDAVAKVRIFTPSYEMQFAGHPTIGTAYVLRQLGIVPAGLREFSFEELIGIVPIRVDEGSDPIIWLKTPPIRSEGIFDRLLCARTLGLSESDLISGVPCELLTAGNPNIFIPLKNPAIVDAAVVDSAALQDLVKGRTSPTCIFAFAPTEQGAYSRMFAPELGVFEDPATGSATGPLAAFMMKHGLVDNRSGKRFISEQGTKMGRRSILHVLINGQSGSTSIEVGGNVAPFSTASVNAPSILASL